MCFMLYPSVTYNYGHVHGCNTSINDYKTGNGRKIMKEARSHNHRCNGKAVSITYSECVSVALGIQHVMIMRNIVICVLPSYTVFSTFYKKRYDFQKKKKIKLKCLLDFLYNFFSDTFLV
jgi:hypothetical protein